MKRGNKRTKEEDRKLKKKLGFIPYDPLPILSLNAHYNIIWSERSNGKTFGFLKIALEDFFYERKRSVYLRRYDLDIRGAKGQEIVEGLNADGFIYNMTNGIYDRIVIKARKAYLAKYDEELDKIITDNDPFLYMYSMTQVGHDKGTFIPDLKYIIFDEFIEPTGEGGYLRDEFVIFKNCLSTFIRYRDDIKIFLLGNTINPFNPYFNWLGLTNARKQKQGTIETYVSEKDNLKTLYAAEYAENSKKKSGGIGKPSDIYFTFDKSSMVAEGQWELKEYPVCPIKFNKDDIIFIYFISFHEYLLQCEIVVKNSEIFTFIHQKTTDLKNPENELIYTPSFHFEKNYSRNIMKPKNEIERKIAWFFVNDKVFYQNNEIGDVVENFIQYCLNE